jgi:hypothetical protein
MVSALVFDLTSFFQIATCDIQEEWFADYQIPSKLETIKRVAHDNIIYFLDEKLNTDDASFVIIDLSGADPIFKQDKIDRYVLDRISTITRATFTNSVSIPYSWHFHSEGGSLKSVYAATKNVGGESRIHFDSNPAGNPDLIFFARTEAVIPFHKLRTPDLYLAVRATLPIIVAAPAIKRPKEFLTTGITLSQRLPASFARGATLDQWYQTKLTDEQRAFVDKPYQGPVRLRGVAGTGKTLSLVIKFLRDACSFENAHSEKRFCFLTHSSGTVDLVNGICIDLDPIGVASGMGKHVTLQVRTLYDLAYEFLRFDLDKLNPLSLDGREGRQLQSELIASILDTMRAELSFARFNDISEHLQFGWNRNNTAARERLVSELMNEFASVLDADGVWAGTDKGEKYAKGQLGYRPTWLMDLPIERDRRFVLEIHRHYRNLLADMDTLSVDQMVGDLNSFLDGNTWDHLKKTRGFDAIFVDELHLFTSIERQVLHKLVRNTVSPDGVALRPSIFMAYDVKQSPRDTFTQIGEKDSSLFSASTQLQNSDLIKLSKVFRYTPQIAEFLYDLDATFPAIDLAGEWEEYAATAEVAEGERPTLIIFKDEAELIKIVVDTAIRQARRLGGRRVAILCVNETLFDHYDKVLKIRFKDRLIHISSRDTVLDLQHAGKKPILSMPEYVAGLQFEAVHLIHVDAQDAPKEMNIGERRRLISSVYLGASRAERDLHISCCETRGGAASVLGLALERRTLIVAK